VLRVVQWPSSCDSYDELALSTVTEDELALSTVTAKMISTRCQGKKIQG
jgi:hypothetical protein